MEAAQDTFISSTMWTERIGPAAALATVKKHRSTNAANHLVDIGKKIQKGWRNEAQTCGLNISVGGIPPLSHFAFEYENSLAMKAYFVQLMLESGFLASTLFYAMYAHKNEHANRYLEKVGEVFGKIVEADSNGSLESKLKGKPAVSGFKRIA
jgi:glutamate-1-semialdehyde aminotransferase